jgi:ACS family tartrate transporter-like MFS transporter
MTKPNKADVESAVVKKTTIRILPFVMLLYFVSFLDRVNVGFAALSMNKAIGLTPAMFGLGGGIFFLGYFLLEVPSNLLLHRVGSRLWIARIMITWGIISAASAFAVGPKSFYALRFALGLAEAGFFPGIIFYLGQWFTVRQRASAIAIFMAAVPLSTVLGSPISGALMELPRTAGLSNWQWLYVLEGVHAVILGLLIPFVLTDRPEQAKWLNPGERKWLSDELKNERAAATQQTPYAESIVHAFQDLRVWALALAFFGLSAGLYALSIWTPLILSQFGFRSSTIGWLSAIPGIASIPCMIVWSWHSDRNSERRWHIVIPSLATAAAFAWVARSHTALGIVAAMALINICMSLVKGPLWSVPAMFLAGPAAAAGIALINSLGNLGGFVGPYAIGWLKNKTGSYQDGLYVVALTFVVTAIVTLFLFKGSQHGRLRTVGK